MSYQLPPPATEEDCYDRWFRAKVEESLADPGPGIPHKEVMAQMDAVIHEAEKLHQRARKKVFCKRR
jgi:hypothetical protein